MSDTSSPSLFNRTLGRLSRAWRDVAHAGRTASPTALAPDLPDDDIKRLREQIDACLQGRGGEVSARGRAAELGRAYLGLNGQGRARFLGLLATDYGVARDALNEAMDTVRAATDEAALDAAEARLRDVLVPPRVRLMTQFNELPEGLKFLVDLRAELTQLSREDGKLAVVESDLKHLLTSWFDVGLLELRRITWNAPAALLERLIDYEAVHQIRSWDDLKNRLDSDRRCYAFIHSRMPDEPLIFIEVALVSGMADNIHVLLDESAPAEDPNAADSAIFYSISNAQTGLAGVNFGGFLIKRVVDDVARDFKGIKTFATLSPLPGFRDWLDNRLMAGDDTLLTPAEHKKLIGVTGEADGMMGLAGALSRSSWHDDGELCEALRGPLVRNCARFLVQQAIDGRALDRVAHFHLSNGARVERINWLADLSDSGMRQSAGLMVNYLYKLEDIEANHEAYRGDGRITVAAAVKNLLKS